MEKCQGEGQCAGFGGWPDLGPMPLLTGWRAFGELFDLSKFQPPYLQDGDNTFHLGLFMRAKGCDALTEFSAWLTARTFGLVSGGPVGYHAGSSFAPLVALK